MLLVPVLTVAQVDSMTLQLITAAKARTQVSVRYDGSYQRIEYPGGDVASNIGVCTDLIVRSYRVAGIDLQRRVHEDMREAFSAYPAFWGLARPDSNIDHRRVPNLQKYFVRHGAELPVTQQAVAYQPGDLVTWVLPGNLPHIGLVSDLKSEDQERFLILHNVGAGPTSEDFLFAYPITGHYRYPPR